MHIFSYISFIGFVRCMHFEPWLLCQMNILTRERISTAWIISISYFVCSIQLSMCTRRVHAAQKVKTRSITLTSTLLLFAINILTYLPCLLRLKLFLAISCYSFILPQFLLFVLLGAHIRSHLYAHAQSKWMFWMFSCFDLARIQALSNLAVDDHFQKRTNERIMLGLYVSLLTWRRSIKPSNMELQLNANSKTKMKRTQSSHMIGQIERGRGNKNYTFRTYG